jgi:flagellar motor switch protein FliM
MAGNANSGRKQEKPFRDALRLEIERAERGEECFAKKGTLRWNAALLLEKGDVQAIKEIADRLDGKVPQGLIGGDEGDSPLAITLIELVAGNGNSQA